MSARVIEGCDNPFGRIAAARQRRFERAVTEQLATALELSPARHAELLELVEQLGPEDRRRVEAFARALVERRSEKEALRRARPR